LSKAFHALDINTDGNISVLTLGIGSLTEARTSTIYQRDWEDIWRPYGSTEPGWFKARKVENLCLQSKDFSTTWAATNATLLVNQSAGPDGSISADRIYNDATSGRHYYVQVIPVATVQGSVSIISFFVRDNDAGVVMVGDGGDSSWHQASFTFATETVSDLVNVDSAGYKALSNGLYLVWITYTWIGASGYHSPAVGPLLTAGTYSYSGSGESIDVVDAQLEHVSGQIDQTPSEHISTTTAAVSKVFGTNRSGVAFASPPWLYGGPAGTNEITYSRDLTNAVWAGSAVVALDAVGLEGVANTASTVTDNDGAVSEDLLEGIVVSNDSNSNTLRIFIKKDSDETRFPALQLAYAGGTDQRHEIRFNTKTGDFVSVNALGTGASEVNDVGYWWEILIQLTNNTTGNSVAYIWMHPALRLTLNGVDDVSTTGSMIVGNVELHRNKSIAQVRGSTPIFTFGSTVSVDATDLSFDDANHVDLQGAYYAEFKNVGINNTDSTAGLLGMGAGGRIWYTFSTPHRFINRDGSSGDTNGPTITLAADDTEFKVGLAYGSGNKRVNTDNVWTAVGAYDGAYDNTENKLNVLHDRFTSSAPTAVMLLRNLRRYDMTYAEAIEAIPDMMNDIFPSEVSSAAGLGLTLGKIGMR